MTTNSIFRFNFFAAASVYLLSSGSILIAGMISFAGAASAPTKAESLDELHEKAKKEGGKLNLYASLSGNSIEVILPAFQKRFPGITVDHTDATGDKLIARIVAEGRGGRVIADTFGGGLAYIAQMAEQKLLARWVASEEGQRVFAQAGETPAHPNVESVEKVRPTAAYMLSQDDVKEFPKYEKIWKDISKYAETAHGELIGAFVGMRTKVTNRGQVSVPSEVRRKLRIGPNTILEWVVEGATARVIPLPDDPVTVGLLHL